MTRTQHLQAFVDTIKDHYPFEKACVIRVIDNDLSLAIQIDLSEHSETYLTTFDADDEDGLILVGRWAKEVHTMMQNHGFNSELSVEETENAEKEVTQD